MLERLGRLLKDTVQEWMGVPAGETHEIRGIRVLVENTRPDIATPDVLERLDQALGLIERYQPWRFRHLRRDLAYIWVTRYSCRGAYFPDRHACMTELTFLARLEFSAAQVASSIVHEGVHARVHRTRRMLGGGALYPDRAREERLCRKAELQFGNALPPELGAPVIERAMASLALSDEDVAPVIDWNLARARQEQADREASGNAHPGRATPNP